MKKAINYLIGLAVSLLVAGVLAVLIGFFVKRGEVSPDEVLGL